jgi:polysaccharide biosynthesis protein PelG
LAGIGFSLRQLSRQDTLSSSLMAHVHAGSIACGPWLLTIGALGMISVLASGDIGERSSAVFSAIVIYNFSFSLVFTGPLIFFMTRRISDSLYEGRPDRIPTLLCESLVLVFLVQAMVGAVFYAGLMDLPVEVAIWSTICLVLISGIWIGVAFLGALYGYSTITLAFGAGMALAAAATYRLGLAWGVAGMLCGFSIGLATILYILMGRITAEHPYPVARLFRSFAGAGAYWELAVIGLFYNAGMWVDKWVMWRSPGNAAVVPGLHTHPAYDTGTFFAMLTIVPAMTLFLISVETRFFERYKLFYADIAGHATAEKITRNQASLKAVIAESAISIVVMQTVICYLALLVAPELITWLGGGLAPVPIFRLAVLGGLFHILLLFCMIILFYLDLRRYLVRISVLFFVLNAGLTLAQVATGIGYPGYGYFLASMLSMIYAYFLVVRSLGDLQYLTFIGNNPGLR